MHLPSSACRIAKDFPDAKFIVLLRDPVMRAMSQWNMVRIMSGKDKILDFDKEVEAELEIMRAKQCSFEATAAASTAPAGSGPWVRDPSIPSWNSCFRCQFMWCGTYSGPANPNTVSFCTSSHIHLHA